MTAPPPRHPANDDRNGRLHAPDSAAARLAEPMSASSITEWARSFGPDDLPDQLPSPQGRQWHYPWGQFEIGALHRTVAAARRAVRHVDYTDNIAAVANTAIFRSSTTAAVALHVRSTGTVTPDDRALVTLTHLENGETVMHLAAGASITLTVATQNASTPAALSFRDGDDALDWEASIDARTWHATSSRPGDDVPPHLRGEPTVVRELSPMADNFFELPAPLLGEVSVKVGEGTPVLSVGESFEEAAASPSHAESRTDVHEAAPGVFVSDNALGLRFASVEGAMPAAVSVQAHVRPVARRGGFVSSDVTLNRIWATGAYTLRMCMQTFLLDGIKRDRLPWIGDHALGILTNAFAFGDGDVVRNTLIALGRPSSGYINGIADYSLWWVISHGMYQRYFGDADFAKAEADHIHAFLEHLASYTTDHGILRPKRVAGSFEHTGPGAVFLDWGVSLREEGDPTALQLLWFWALQSGAQVLRQARHNGAARWSRLADQVHDLLIQRAWNPATRLWLDYLDDAPSDDSPSAYPSFLATLAGITPAGGDESTTARFLVNSSTGTPFMRSFALLALGRLGDREGAVSAIRRLWGRMLDSGAQTFWEEFDAGSSPYEMYGRPFGKSLCHAWAAGPVALLPELVFGLRPLHDGWSEFTLDPDLGDLDWAEVVVPSPLGDIVVRVDADHVIVDVPEGAVMHYRGTRYAAGRMDAPRANISTTEEHYVV